MATGHARGNLKPKVCGPRSKKPSKEGGKPKDLMSIPIDLTSIPICREFLRKQCNRGNNCLYYHPPEDVRYGDPQEVWRSEKSAQHSAWFTICQSQRMGKCNRLDCRDFHIPVEDANLFKTRREVAPHLVDQIMDQSIRMDLDFVCTQPYCKDFLRGECNLMSCQDRHVGQRDFEKEVYEVLREEMHHLLGSVGYLPPTHLRDSFLIDGVDLPRPHSPPRPRYMEDMGSVHNLEPADDMRATIPRDRFDLLQSQRPCNNYDLEPPLRPHDDFEPQHKLARYREDFSNDTRDGFPTISKDYCHGMCDMHENSKESDHIVHDIFFQTKINADLKSNAERKIEELKEDLNKTMQDYRNLQTEIFQTSNAQQATLKNVMDSNTTLVQELHTAQAAKLNLEKSNSEMRSSLDSLIKVAIEEKQKLESFEKRNVILNKELDTIHDNLAAEKKNHDKTKRDLSNTKITLSDYTSKVKEMIDVNKKLFSDNMSLLSENKSLLLGNKSLSSELVEAKTKLRVITTSVDVYQKSRFINNDGYSRDMGRGIRPSETDHWEVDDHHETSHGRNPMDFPPRRDASLEERNHISKARHGEPEERKERDLGQRSEADREDPSQRDWGQRNKARQRDVTGRSERSRGTELSHWDRPDRGGSQGDYNYRNEEHWNQRRIDFSQEDVIDLTDEGPEELFGRDDMGQHLVDQRNKPERTERHHESAPYLGDSIPQDEAKQCESNKRDKPKPSLNQGPSSTWRQACRHRTSSVKGDNNTNSVRNCNSKSLNYNQQQDPKTRNVEGDLAR